MDSQSAINEGYAMFQEDSSPGASGFTFNKGYIADHSPSHGHGSFLEDKDTSQQVKDGGYDDDADIPANSFPADRLSLKSKWNKGSKRFNEFLGKRSLLASSSYPQIILNKLMKDQLSASDEENLARVLATMGGNSRAVWAKLFQTADKQRREILMRLFRNVFRLMTAKDTPKRQYEFVGKRFDEDSDPLMVNPAAMVYEDGQDKRYEFLGKRNYDFLGKRNYDFLGKRSYDFLGKKSYDFLGKKSYDFLGKKSYDFLGKRPYLDDNKRSYDFLGKRPAQYEGAMMENSVSQNDRGSMDGFVSNGLAPKSVVLPTGIHHTNRRYSEWLGKRKRSTMPFSTQQRLALLLRNNTLRKRLSRMLMNSRVSSTHQAPEFIGK